jgi:hypothetical protein
MRKRLKHWHLVASGALLLGLLWVWRSPPPDRAMPDPTGRPWQVERLADGHVRALGLVPGRSTLGEAIGRYGKRVEGALFESVGRGLTVEVFYGEVSAGGITGRLVLALNTSPELAEGLRARSPGSRRVSASTVRYELDPQDGEVLLGIPVRLLSFFPTADLSAETVRARFGEPSDRVVAGGDQESWLYPERGVAVTLRVRDKDTIDYFDPADLPRVRDALATPPPERARGGP